LQFKRFVVTAHKKTGFLWAGSEMDMSWFHPWVGLVWAELGWIKFLAVVVGLVELLSIAL